MKLLLDALQGKYTDRVPIWFMRQAGRYLPEYRKLREGKTFEDMVQNPDIAKEVTIQPIKRFDLDAAIIFSDILIPLYALDIGLEIKPGIGPIIERPIAKPEDISKLEMVYPKESYPYVFESIQKVKKELPNKTALIGFSGAPFTLASYLIEGKSTRDALKTKAFYMKYLDKYHSLLDFITEMLIHQLKVQVEAGAEVLQIFDSWAGFLSASTYEKIALPYTRKIIEDPAFKNIPIIHFARGSGHLLPNYLDTKADCISVDTSLDMTFALELIPKDIIIQGNLDPAILFTNKDFVNLKVSQMLELTRSKSGYIFNLGNGINKDTPIENVHEMVETVKAYIR